MHVPVCLTEDAVMQLFEENRAGIAGLLKIKLGNPQLTDDIVQEARIAVYQHWREFDPDKGSFFKWASVIALRKGFAALHKQNRQKILLESPLIETMLYETERVVSETNWEQQNRALQACLRRLNGFQQRVLKLRLVQARTCADTGALTGQSPGAVRVLAHRLKLLLSQCIRQRLSEDDTL